MRNTLFIILITLSTSVYAAANCPQALTNTQDGLGGGGISSVGGGGTSIGLTIAQIQINSANNMPHLIKVFVDEHKKAIACAYDKHFGETTTPKLVGSMLCRGGSTIKFPRTWDIKVACRGPMRQKEFHLNMQMTALHDSTIAIVKVMQGDVTWGKAILVGH